jgi:hypothetical protein
MSYINICTIIVQGSDGQAPLDSSGVDQGFSEDILTSRQNTFLDPSREAMTVKIISLRGSVGRLWRNSGRRCSGTILCAAQVLKNPGERRSLGEDCGMTRE